MNKINNLLKKLCPRGVVFKNLDEVCIIRTGENVNKNEISRNVGIYPVINSGREPLGFIDKWNTDDDPIGITTRGAGVGYITWCEGKYFRGNLNYSCTIRDKDELSVRYLYFILNRFQKEIHDLCTFDAIPALNKSNLEKLKIPVPHIEIQNEIVKILDRFTELESELEAELEARETQYQYYRDALLNFKNGKISESKQTRWMKLGEIVKMRAGEHIKAIHIADCLDDIKIYPCYGGNGLRGYVENYSHDGKYILIGRQGALCGNVKRTEGKFYATEHAVVGVPAEGIDVDWAFYMLTFMNLNQYATKSAQPGLAVGRLGELKVPVPSFEDQKKIGAILNKFDLLVNDTNEGLPAEIKARRQQYEYYRDRLLTFQEIS